MVLWKRVVLLAVCVTLNVTALAVDEPQNWPSFRGPGATGIADGYTLPTSWNADPTAENNESLLWRAAVPGLGHSSPVVWGDRIFVCTAIAEDGEASLVLGRSGRPTAADDSGQHRWVIICYNKKMGEELWRKTAHREYPAPLATSKLLKPIPASLSMVNIWSRSWVRKDSTVTI